MGEKRPAVAVLVVAAAVWCCLLAAPAQARVAALDLEEVTIPPLLVEQPEAREILFTVTHDPEQPPVPFTLPCSADGLPAPTYEWLKDGQHYDPSKKGPRVELQEGEGTLVFHVPRQEDEGTYQCLAENSVGVAHSDIVSVRRAVMAYIPKQEPRVVTATQGRPLRLVCDAPAGHPDPSVQWFMQSSEGKLRNMNTSRVTMDADGSLWFSHVTPEDVTRDAYYACAAFSAASGQMILIEDEDGNLEMVEQLPADHAGDVLSLPTEYRVGNRFYLNISNEEPTTSLAPEEQFVSHHEQTVLKGHDVRLYCIFGGNPQPEIHWWRGSRADVEGEKKEQHGRVLVLEDVTEEDAGAYYCQASSTAGQANTRQFHVYVEAEPKFTVEPEVINLPQGETAVFSCEATGEPQPVITWTKNGEALDTHDTTLVFDNLDFSKKASIACNASNVHGYVYKTVFLNVLSLPPEWMTEPDSVTVLEGDAATLDCEAYGSPNPNMTWARLEGEERVSIHDEDPRYDIEDTKLVIKSVDTTSAGRYVCTATNKFGSLEAEAEVSARAKTEVKVDLSSERVKARDHVSLTCHVRVDSHLEPTVTWFRQDEEVDFEDSNFILARSENSGDDDDDDDDEDDDRQRTEVWVLEVMKVHGQDSGVYTCQAKTALDHATDNLILTVEDVPNPPRINAAQCGEREALLDWSSSGDNNAPLQGYVVQYVTQFHPDDWKDAENKIPTSSPTYSMELSPGLNYTFRVLAFNRVGMSEPSEYTECASPGLPPDHSPENVTVLPGEPGTLVVSWQPMKREEHNGPDFHYKVLWRPVEDTDDDDGDDGGDDGDGDGEEEGEESDATHPESPADEDNGDKEGDDDDSWHTMEIDDWTRSEVTLDGLPPYTEYQVRVEAHNAYGAAPPMDVTPSFFSGADVPEDAPEDLQALDVDSTEVVLTWSPVSPESVRGPLLGYKVEYWIHPDDDDDDSDDGIVEEVLVTGPQGRADVTDLHPNTAYRARVSVVNKDFPGPPSPTLAFTTAEGESGPVVNLRAKQMGENNLLVDWDQPTEPNGVIKNFRVQYTLLNEAGEEEGETHLLDEHLAPDVTMVKVPGLEEGASYRVSVTAKNGAGWGEGSSIDVDLEATEPQKPAVPVFEWSLIPESDDDDDDEGLDKDGDGDVDKDDIRNKNMIIGDTDGDGDVDSDDVLDTDNDGDIDEDDIEVADINNDGVVDEKDVAAADRDGDGDVDIADIGDEDGDGDFDGADVIAADEDKDGDIDIEDENEENTLLEDRDQDGDIDRDDVTDINLDGVIDEKDFRAADTDNDGDVDQDDVALVDKDGDGDIDAADIGDLDGDGVVDGDDLEVTDRDGDGDVDARDFQLRKTFLADTNQDGVINEDDVLDTDNDGDIDGVDRGIADINNDGDVDINDIKAGDRDGDGDVDVADIGDEDNDGDIDGFDVIAADEDGDGDIDADDDDEEHTLLEDRDGDGDFDRDDVVDMDGDGDVDLEDMAAADIDDDGDVDMDDIRAADKDGDGDVDAADVADLDGDGDIDAADIEVDDRDGDGDIDAKDFIFQDTLLADTDGDGDVDNDDVLDIDGDGDIDEADFRAADIDDDGDVDADDVRAGDKDGDNKVDAFDVEDIDGDGMIDEDDLDVEDRDGDGDIDKLDFRFRNTFLADTNLDGKIDKDDVLDTDNDGDVDEHDFEVADINNDGDVDSDDILAGDRDHDGDIDKADIGDEDGDGDIDGADVIAADEDKDGDIDAADDDGESMLLFDSDDDGDIDQNDLRDIDGDGKIDESDLEMADVDGDGDFDEADVQAADRDGDGDVDAADIPDIDGDGDVDGRDLLAADKDNDGDIDSSDIRNLDVFLKDTDGDGDVDEDDVLDSDHDGDIDEEDIAVADIDNDGDIDEEDVRAGDRDGDGDVDFKDIGDIDGDGDIDGNDVEMADKDDDGDIDAADEGRGLTIRIDLRPSFEDHPGADFYVQSRRNGSKEWKNSSVQREDLQQTVSGIDPRHAYEVRVVARDGPFETPSEIIIIPASEGVKKTATSGGGEVHETLKNGNDNEVDGDDTSLTVDDRDLDDSTAGANNMEEPTAVAKKEDLNPILWTWFIIAIMVAVTMICVIFFSMWVYSQRLARVAELRKALYKGYEPAEPEPIKKEVDLEAGKPEEPVEDEMTANFQRKQLAAMMKRQETIQSVDSFASHDDDFAEYGDESMAIDLLSSVSLVTNPRHQRPPPVPRT
ncbi:uncharacterized protein LOC126981013 isoform X4 [Eriocheir sinensis]|uniref:uncharacterized protein LOC126981013 isoform X4 n=1 Tax=Eriocheir sinensis TaxID=95602 RepID=UPI0021C8F124|nr:uncharacterized protein LOC126981013 isoform X4 [Eriocheir sinensis]